jgi:hypothetical protein
VSKAFRRYLLADVLPFSFYYDIIFARSRPGVMSSMDVEPPDWWIRLKLKLFKSWPMEPRKKSKRLMQLGDEFHELGSEEIAQLCYRWSWEIAEEARAVHLRKQLERRYQP